MMDDDDDWQEMPVVKAGGPSSSSPSSSSSDEAGPGHTRQRDRGKKAGAYSARHAYKHGRTNSGYGSTHLGDEHASYGNLEQYDSHITRATNATGVKLDIDDARGYKWRARPDLRGDKGAGSPAKAGKGNQLSAANRRRRKGKKSNGADGASSSSSSEDSSDGDADEGGARGYTQLRLDDDPEAEDLNAATDYLFTGASGAGGSRGRAMDEVDGTGATPHSQLNTTKNLLSEGQKIAYVGLVSLAAKQLIRQLERVPGKDMKHAVTSATEWRLRVVARLYQHMDINASEQRMIESLADHGVLTSDLAPSLIMTQTVDNPDFDPEALLEREQQERERAERELVERATVAEEQGDLGVAEEASKESGEDEPLERPRTPVYAERPRSELSFGSDDGDIGATPRAPAREEGQEHGSPPPEHEEDDGDGDLGFTPEPKIISATSEALGEEDQPRKGNVVIVDPNTASRIETMGESLQEEQVTAMGLTSKPQTIDAMPSALEGVTTELSSADRTITLDLRWTVLCDLFLVLTADSVYDSRSRVLLERIAEELQLSWMDVTKFEKRVTDALEIEESVSGSLKGKKAVRKRAQMARKRRMVMMGLATVGGGLVIGLSAGLMAPLIGAGLGAALGTIGIGGTTGFLSGVGGATIITSTGIAGGAALGGTGMSKRTRQVSIFEFKPIHNNKRVNCIITVSGFTSGPQDDVRLPFSVVDSIMGDIFSLLWEPDMMQDMGNSINLLWNETLAQGVQQILAATIAGGLVGALAWPLWLTKLGYFIDNPWSNALDRAHACGLILADVLSKRKLGVRPITLVGFSLGARVIFYALVELAKNKKFGIVQNVYLIGAPITANDKTWREARAVVAGRFVNAYSRTDWILGWLFRATTGGLGSIAGLRPVERIPEVENVDVTKTVPGHLQYRAFMPVVLDQLGFRTTAEYFDEPEDLENVPEREVVYDEPEDDRKLKSVQTKTGGFGKVFRRKGNASGSGTDTPSNVSVSSRRPSAYDEDDDDLPPRESSALPAGESTEAGRLSAASMRPSSSQMSAEEETERIMAELRESGIVVRELESSLPPLVASNTSSVRRGSQLRESVPLGDAEVSDDEAEQQQGSEGEGYKPLQGGAPPAVTVSNADEEEEERYGDAVEEQSRKNGADRKGSTDSYQSTSRPYARRFGSTAFDADGLPPSAPQIKDDTSLNLSFSEAYDDDEQEESFDPPPAADKAFGNFESSRGQYGLSAEAARELAKQFQSAGMSSAGAMAAAQIAHRLESGSDSGDVAGVSVSSNAVGGNRVARSGTASYESDPWGAVAPSLDDVTPQPSMQSGSGGGSDNPWG